MQIEFITHNASCIVAIQGSVDALTSSQLTESLNREIQNGHHFLVVDLSQVEFMSSAGLRAILGALKGSRQNGGDLRLAAAQPAVDKVLQVSGFTSILKTYSSVEEALQSLEN
jgi:anti-sigma B factor antagonist